MLPYWFIFCLIAWLTLKQHRASTYGRITTLWRAPWLVMFVLLSLMIGLRFEVGGDWVTYVRTVDNLREVSYEGVFRSSDPAYYLLNWFGANIFGDIYFVNFICSLIFAFGLLTFCRNQPRPWLALLVSVPYLITVVAMGYTRQGVAIGLAMLAMVGLLEGNLRRFFIFITLATLFHKSAIILIPLAIFSGKKNRYFKVLGVTVIGILLYVLLLAEHVDSLTQNYLGTNYSSSGAAVRIAMNALPAVLFLIYKRKFYLEENTEKFWTWMSYGALFFIVLFFISSSSTAVDRVALYWIPIQLFVLSRLPDVLGKPGFKNAFWVSSVVLYSAAVLFVWLIFAIHSYAWLPYQFYPWVALWS